MHPMNMCITYKNDSAFLWSKANTKKKHNNLGLQLIRERRRATVSTYTNTNINSIVSAKSSPLTKTRELYGAHTV